MEPDVNPFTSIRTNLSFQYYLLTLSHPQHFQEFTALKRTVTWAVGLKTAP